MSVASVEQAASGSGSHPFKGRTVAVVNDLTRAEQWYLYQKTRELKEAVRSAGDLDPFRLRNKEAAVYTIFMEDSTRTKESFRNAAEFHGMKVNVFDAKTSSFQKNETITDTIKMLCGYSIGQSVFVIRSKLEGVCRWLEEAIADYTKLRGYPRASFINAGDGRHEHPTQEFLDEFSFLEHKGWDTESIHVVLLGDLYHGRTIHSKVDGLKIYNKVEVDLVAPPELALPKMYEDRMVAAGFTVRKYESIDAYLAQDKVSKIWYFTRLQLERMGDKVLTRQLDLRRAVTFQREQVDLLPPGTRFFHPLPRDARFPVLPFWLDNTELNGWDQQSQNGYFTRITLLGMLGGHLGSDFEPVTWNPSKNLALPVSPPKGDDEASALGQATDFIKEVPIDDQEDTFSKQAGLAPIANGILICQLAEGQSEEQIWALLYMVRSILGLNSVGGQGVSRSSEGGPASGFISSPDFDLDKCDKMPLKKLAAMAPGSTLYVISDSRVRKRFQLQVPPRIYNFPDMSCKNTACVSHRSNMQHEVPPYFLRAATSTMSFICKYCEAPHGFWQIWDYKHYTDIDQFSI
eukprot:TRINITY_DN31137_c0_g1_i1.p1 TRINITY_DN31137_c0_g1~~TRINITY_DN31137_c0_g1_i1.p1  ORF type:complete len:616 (-),score=123.08 TRINITY_DN31137_c0_g1_i1:201-1922(-)